MPHRFGYSRWDGTQQGFELDADDVLRQVTDDLLYHGDAHAALRRLLQSGFDDRAGRRVQGVNELLERLRRRRREELARHDGAGPYQDVARRLREVVEQDRAAIDRLVDQARASGDARRREVAEGAAAERRLRLDLLPSDLAGRVRALQDHEFTSPEAHQRFLELLEELRREALQAQFNRMADALADVSPQRLAQMREMFDALNRLIEMRAAGADTTAAFAAFMHRFGSFFPGRPSTLDELLEQLAAQMAAAEAALNSMSPDQQRQLRELAAQVLGDLDLRWQMDRLGRNLRAAFPEAGWDRAYSFGGHDPLGLPEAAAVADRLGDLDDLERLLRSAASPGALADADLDRARQALGDDAARSLEQLARLARALEEAGLVEHREGRLELTPQGLRRLGRNALSDLFERIGRDRFGGHRIEEPGAGHERSHETKAYEFGDPFNLSIERTVRNAIGRAGAGVPVRLAPDDFEVERTEAVTRASTVLLLDLSLSMPIRENFLAAKKMAVALHSLISTRFPRDYLGVVGFSEVAREIDPRRLPEVSWDFVLGTNMQHALALARRLLAHRPGTRQVLMVTDGEPTAHVRAGGEVFCNYPPVPETVDATLAEVHRCTREGIRINTFMLDATRSLTEFVERLTRLNRGRAFFTTPETLGDYVLVDFLEQRRSARRRRPA